MLTFSTSLRGQSEGILTAEGWLSRSKRNATDNIPDPSNHKQGLHLLLPLTIIGPIEFWDLFGGEVDNFYL